MHGFIDFDFVKNIRFMYKAHVKLSKTKKRALKNMAPVNDLLLENRSQQETDIAVDPSILKKLQ